MPFNMQFSKDLTIDIRKCPHLLIVGVGDVHSKFANTIGKMINADDYLASIFEKTYNTKFVDAVWTDNDIDFDDYNWVGGIVNFDTGNNYKFWNDKMDERYQIYSALGCNNIEQYNDMFKHEQERYCFVLTTLEQSPTEENINYLRQILMRGRAVGIHVIMFVDGVEELAKYDDLLDMFAVKLLYKVKTVKESVLLTGYKGAENLTNGEFMLSELGKQPVIYKNANIVKTAV